MVLEVPGLSLSILRQDTQTSAGKPVLITGRFTAFGLGIPGFIRVKLEGPSYNPEITTFDAFAEPFSGNWSVQVIAQKDGQYQLQAEAYPGPAVPTGPLFPANLVLVPPIAVSTSPPLNVGILVPGGVNAQTPEGSEFLSTPAQTPIELLTTVGAPSVSVSIPSGAPTFPGLPTLPGVFTLPSPTPPYTPTVPTPTTPEVPTPTTPTIPTPTPPPIPTVPEIPTPTGLGPPTFPVALTGSLIGTPLGDLRGQVNAGDTWSGFIQIPTVIPAAPAGIQQLVAGAPELPTYQPTVVISLEGPTGVRTEAARTTTAVQLGQPLYVPISFNTATLPEPAEGMTQVRYNVYLTVINSGGATIFDRNIGVLYVVYLPTAPLPGLPGAPGLPEVPTAPTAAMFSGIPTLNAPRTLELGETWSGSLGVPTTVPSALSSLPSLPSFPVTLGLSLRSPSGQEFPIKTLPTSFRPGDSLNVPFSINTSQLAGAGTYTILLSVKDRLGNTLIPGMSVGPLGILPAPPTPPEMPTPEVPTPSAPGLPSGPSVFSNPTVSLSPRSVQVGDTVTIPFRVNHQGLAETRTMRGAIGQSRLGMFDEILSQEQSASFGLDPTPKSYSFNIPVRITSAISPGTYGIQAKVKGSGPGGLIGQSVSPAQYGVVQVQAAVPAAPPAPTYNPRISAASSVQQGKYLNFSLSGFPPNTRVNVSVAGGGGATITTNGGGSVNGSLGPITDSVGTHTLIADDGKGHRATANFSVTSGVQPKLQASNVQRYSRFNFSFSGFPANSNVSVAVVGGGGVTVHSNSSGSGSGNFINNDRPGTYTLRATSGSVSATTTFQVTPSATITTAYEVAHVLFWAFRGFQPKSPVQVYLQGGGGLTYTSDALGGGAGQFKVSEASGRYTLVAQDNYGNKATKEFII